jgi:biopolymer transport protein ExbD
MAGFKKRAMADSEMDITPMIDCTFLLLIFFMVTSTMDSSKQSNVPPAKNGVGIDARGASFVTIKAAPGGAQPELIMGDTKGETANSVEQVKRYVEQEFSTGKKICIIKADRDVTSGKVQEVLKSLAEIEGISFAVGVQDKK